MQVQAILGRDAGKTTTTTTNIENKSSTPAQRCEPSDLRR